MKVWQECCEQGLLLKPCCSSFAASECYRPDRNIPKKAPNRQTSQLAEGLWLISDFNVFLCVNEITLVGDAACFRNKALSAVWGLKLFSRSAIVSLSSTTLVFHLWFTCRIVVFFLQTAALLSGILLFAQTSCLQTQPLLLIVKLSSYLWCLAKERGGGNITATSGVFKPHCKV